MDEGIARGLGRIESQLDQVLTHQREQGQTLAKHDVRLDRVEGDVAELKTASVADAKHDVRLDRVEGDVAELKNASVADDRHGMSFRSSLMVALISVSCSGVLAYAVALLNAR